MFDKIAAGMTGRFAAPLLAKALLVVLPMLVASVALNLHQFGKAYSAAAECRASKAEAILKAIEDHKQAQAAAQREIDEAASVSAQADDNTLAEIVSSTESTLAQLRRQYADAMLRRPVDCARMPAVGLRTVNAALSRPRPD